MVKIGVDSSGHTNNPPIWFVASRRSKKKGQMKSTLYVSEKKHDELIESFKRSEKLSAALIYKVAVSIFYEGDVLVVDRDFDPSSQKYIAKYLRRLFRATYPKRPLMANPTIFFLRDIHDESVKDAHIKTQRLRHKNLRKEMKDPSLTWELEKLG